MVRENIHAAPIIDENSDFLGVIEKDKIVQAAVNLLTKREVTLSYLDRSYPLGQVGRVREEPDHV